ncbi:MAG TPA: hypothetical protein DEQ34_06810 [Balneolaceae bacterium]|nr:hypothetical protein [Balneolaceae bacterium]|tara:strand:+ start:15253 stop:15798 length:546 start_codon:yes stop_codon:yes gene_type:complete
MKTSITLLLLVFLSVQAMAQHSNQPERKGFMIGVSAGMGFASITGDAPELDNTSDINLPNLKLGWMVKPNLAVLITNPGASYQIVGKDRSFDGIIPSLQYWTRPEWWVSGGFGLGMDGPAFYETGNTKLGPACQFSTGYEFYRKGRFTLDIQATLFAGSVETDNGSREAVSLLTGIGFNFY